MNRIVCILGLVLTLAMIIVAPAREAYAAVTFVTAPMVQMDEGAPCLPKSCEKMPDCPMAIPGLTASVAIPAAAARTLFQPTVQTVHFAFALQLVPLSLDGSGLRRPPKV